MTKRIFVPFFPKGLKYATPLVFGGGLYLILTHYVLWGLPLLLIGVIVLTTRYVTEINLKEKKYRDYLFFLGAKLDDEMKKFNHIDRIVIAKGNYSQTINTRAQTRQMDWSDYTATLLLDNDSLDLLTKNTKKELLIGLKEFTDLLKVGVEDRTTMDHYWIDMSHIDPNSKDKSTSS